MKKFAVTLLSLALATAGFAKPFSEDRWTITQADVDKLGTPTFAMDVKWIKNAGDSPIPEWKDGTCTIWLEPQFGSERSLFGMGEILQRCASLGAKVVNARPAPGARRIAVYVVPVTDDIMSVSEMMAKVFDIPQSMVVGRGLGTRFVPIHLHHADGVYFDPDGENGTCTIVGHLVALGHEELHCEMGQFHDRTGKWLKTGD